MDDDRSREMAWVALQIDDLSLFLRAWGFEEMADQFEKARDTLEDAITELESAA